ncbi:hypothetical protein SESBI_39907 [Sesbania bispinosa]|nr:hypothetical protein SESBI_39907 [Sesbania bispinosa]
MVTGEVVEATLEGDVDEVVAQFIYEIGGKGNLKKEGWLKTEAVMSDPKPHLSTMVTKDGFDRGCYYRRGGRGSGGGR